VAAGLCLLNLLFAWWMLPESRRDPGPGDSTAERAASPAAPRPRRSILGALLEVLHHPALPLSSLILIYAIGMMAFMGMNGVLALYLGEKFGVTEKTIGWFFAYVGSVSLVMRAVLLGPAVRRFGEVGVTRLGSLSLVGGLVALPLAPNLPLLALAVLFVPVGTALLFPATTALVSRYVERGETGQAMGVQHTYGGVSRMLGPLWAGAAYQGLGIRTPFFIGAALMLGVSFLTRQLRLERAPAHPLEGGAEALNPE
jgi:predicted MFS family arabinose efflux permease